jgi:hypothetical protein
MIFMGRPFLLVCRARLHFGERLAEARDADYRSTLFEVLREDHP